MYRLTYVPDLMSVWFVTDVPKLTKDTAVTPLVIGAILSWPKAWSNCDSCTGTRKPSSSLLHEVKTLPTATIMIIAIIEKKIFSNFFINLFTFLFCWFLTFRRIFLSKIRFLTKFLLFGCWVTKSSHFGFHLLLKKITLYISNAWCWI